MHSETPFPSGHALDPRRLVNGFPSTRLVLKINVQQTLKKNIGLSQSISLPLAATHGSARLT